MLDEQYILLKAVPSGMLSQVSPTVYVDCFVGIPPALTHVSVFNLKRFKKRAKARVFRLPTPQREYSTGQVIACECVKSLLF